MGNLAARNADEVLRARLYDASRLLALRAALRWVETETRPRGELVFPVDVRPVGRLGLLPGSFNPLTVAHTELAAAGLAGGAIDRVLFTLSTHTIDKESVTGATLEDRLLVLQLAAEDDGRLGVLLVNRGLYVEQAELVRAAFPSAREVVFLVGWDKIVQIFDRRYYDDRDAALERLFALAGFLVAPRGDAGAAELSALLDRPENRRFVGAVRPLALPPALREVASSRVRAEVRSGVPPPDQLPPAARVFVEETGAYGPRPTDGASPDRYRLRLALLDALETSQGGSADAEDADFRALFDRALAERR